MDQINEYKVFQGQEKAKISPKSRKVSNGPDGYQKIRVHLIFAVKHDGRHKARLVAGGHLTPDPMKASTLELSPSDPLIGYISSQTEQS